MILITSQVAERLGISSGQVKTLVKNGKLTPVNKAKNGAKKFFMKFDSKDVNEYIKTNKIKPANESSNVGEGFNTRLDRIESKIDKLIKLWS